MHELRLQASLVTKSLTWKLTFLHLLPFSFPYLSPPPLSLSHSHWYHLFPEIFTFSGTLPWPNRNRLFNEQKAITSHRVYRRRTKWRNGIWIDIVEYLNWMAATIDRYRFRPEWRQLSVDFRAAKRLTRRVKWMKAVAKLFSPGIEASTAGEVIDFRGVHTNRDRKKRERERGSVAAAWEAIIKQQVVASSRKFMSSAPIEDDPPVLLNFNPVLPPLSELFGLQTVFANRHSHRSTTREQQLIVKRPPCDQ